jgi:hypothetical protein
MSPELPSNYGSSPNDRLYHYDLGGRMIYDHARNGASPRTNIWLGGLLLAQYDGATLQHALSDHLGTPQYYYFTFGETLAADIVLRPFGEVEAATGPSKPLRFPGQYDDPETEVVPGNRTVS